MNTNGFRVGDTVKLTSDWLPRDVKRKRVQITAFQRNGMVIFAKVFWKGNSVQNYNILYGDLFPIEELKK